MQILDKLNFTTVQERHHRADTIQVFKVLNDRSQVFLVDFLKLSDRLGRRNSSKLYKKRYCVEVCKLSCTSRVVDEWNKLPDKVVLSVDVNHFKQF